MNVYCCESPGQLPAAPIDWATRYEEAGEDEDAIAAVNIERLATTSHVVRNGGAMRVGEPGNHRKVRPSEPTKLVPVEGEDPRVALVETDQLLRCPECLSFVRWSELT